jgi:RAVE protein 1 C terminal
VSRQSGFRNQALQLSSCEFAWAMQSEAHDALLAICAPGSAVDWEAIRGLGVIYWLQNPSSLQQLVDVGISRILSDTSMLAGGFGVSLELST